MMISITSTVAEPNTMNRIGRTPSAESSKYGDDGANEAPRSQQSKRQPKRADQG